VGFSIRQLAGFLCVVIERERCYFYRRRDKRYAVSFKMITPNLMAMSEDGTLYLTQRKQLSSRHSFSVWPFESKEVDQEVPTHKNSSSGKTVYFYHKFNCRKGIISPDYKHTFSGHIDLLQVKHRLLIIAIHPEILLYDTRTRQIVLKF